MLSNTTRLLTAALLTCSAIVTAVSMIRSAQGVDAGVLIFIAWAISPYICFFAASTLLQRFVRSPHLAAASLVISVLMLLFTVLSYVSIASDTSSTASLAYIVIPVYVYVGSFLLLSAALIISLFLGRAKKA
jgi:hypothetical protein